MVVYRIAHILVGLVLKIFFRMSSEEVEKVPNGGAIIASNHISLWDPPLLGCVLPRHRKLHMMAKEELFSIPVFSWIIRQLGAFPVRRGMADRNAIRTAVRLLADDQLMGIFPEGTRSKTGALGNPLPGMAMIALKAGVPVVPAVIIGTNKVLCDGHILPRFFVKFGEPVYASPTNTDKENMEYINAAVMGAIAKMLQESGK